MEFRSTGTEIYSNGADGKKPNPIALSIHFFNHHLTNWRFLSGVIYYSDFLKTVHAKLGITKHTNAVDA